MRVCIVCNESIADRVYEYGDIGEPMCQRCYFDMIDPSSRELVYGFFSGGDPRDFQPDTESCSPEEIARWKADCESVERGEPIAANHAGESRLLPDGTTVHVLAPPYGIGTYLYPPRSVTYE